MSNGNSNSNGDGNGNGNGDGGAGVGIIALVFILLWFALGIYGIVVAVRCPYMKSGVGIVVELLLAFLVGPFYLLIKLLSGSEYTHCMAHPSTGRLTGKPSPPTSYAPPPDPDGEMTQY